MRIKQHCHSYTEGKKIIKVGHKVRSGLPGDKFKYYCSNCGATASKVKSFGKIK